MGSLIWGNSLFYMPQGTFSCDDDYYTLFWNDKKIENENFVSYQ